MFRKSVQMIVMLVIGIAAMHADSVKTIPAFARKYGLSCTTCHVAAPKLKDYGEEFAGNGFQLPDDDEPVRAFQDVGDDRLLLQRDLPVAIRFDAYARYRSEGEVDGDIQTPYGVKLLSGGNIAKDIGYYFYFYMNERGEVAGLEDAYIHFNNIGGSELDLMVGQFQISDPLFKRELKLTFEDYQIYKTRVGFSTVNLTYDRGIMATYALPTGTDLTLEVVNGSGIGETDRGVFDADNNKNIFAKVNQVIPFGSIGMFIYTGKEDEQLDDPSTFNDETNEFLMMGPDISVGIDMVEVSIQYLRRTDNNPTFRAGFDDDQVTEGIIGEMIVNPFPEKSHLFGTLLYNNVTSDVPGLEYETITASVSYLLKTNLRLVGELTQDTENEETLLTAGFVAGF